MPKITKRRSVIVTLSLLICLGIFNALRPAYGHPQKNELKEQVETLTQKTEEQKKAFDALKTEFEKFKTSVFERDRNTRQLITEHDRKFTADAQTTGRLIESARQQDVVLRQHSEALTQQRNAILNINSRLKAKGI